MNSNATSLMSAWRYELSGPSLPEIHRSVPVPRSATFLRRPTAQLAASPWRIVG
jgi:hypothetical protein